MLQLHGHSICEDQTRMAYTVKTWEFYPETLERWRSPDVMHLFRLEGKVGQVDMIFICLFIHLFILEISVVSNTERQKQGALN